MVNPLAVGEATYLSDGAYLKRTEVGLVLLANNHEEDLASDRVHLDYAGTMLFLATIKATHPELFDQVAGAE